MKPIRWWNAFVVVASLLVVLSGCTSGSAQGPTSPSTTEDPSKGSPIVPYTEATSPELSAPATPAGGGSGPSAETTTTESGRPKSLVRVLDVGFAAEGVYVMVQFKAPPEVARTWGQGTVSVTDESTHVVYDAIPVLPIIGPLLGHPVKATQIGYVMLQNKPPGLAPGAKVTVVLGDFRQEHLVVSAANAPAPGGGR